MRTQNYQTVAECLDGPERLQNCSDNSENGVEIIEKGKHDYKPAAECWDGPDRLQNCSEIGRNGKKSKRNF